MPISSTVTDVIGCLEDFQNGCPYVDGYIQQFEQVQQFACNAQCDSDLAGFAECISDLGPLEYHSDRHDASCL